MSERSEMAERIAAKIREYKLTNPFGGEVSKQGRYYGILFAVPRYLDGLVRIYGSKFILVESQGPASMGSRVFASERDAIAFIHAAFVERDTDKADAVPIKRDREVKKVNQELTAQAVRDMLTPK